MSSSSIATAADYADAMMIARRAKNWLFLILLLMLLVQISLFFVTRMTDYVIADGPPSAATAATQPAATQPSISPAKRELLVNSLRYVTALTNFLGVALILVMLSVLLLITKIMLVGRLIGVAQVTSAFVWCVFLAVLLFPWQAFLQNENFSGDFKIPGVLYTWGELVHPTLGAKFDTSQLKLDQNVLRWARFVGFPALSVVLLLMVQAKSSRGLRAALGESELEMSNEIRVS